jgi:Uma2 family endonuclease
MALAKPERRLTEAEYLEIERRADFKSEFFEGEMFAMSGGTRWHSIITANLVRALGNKLSHRGCVIFDSNMRVKVGETGLYTYPDVSVACEEQQFVDGEMDTLLNPTLIVEVLSESTEKYDRGAKFRQYQSIPSLQEYLLVSQDAPRVELFVRQPNGKWLLQQAEGVDGKLESPTLRVVLELSEIFANVRFEPRALRERTEPPDPSKYI